MDLLCTATTHLVLACKHEADVAQDNGWDASAEEWRTKAAKAEHLQRTLNEIRQEFDLDPHFILQVTVAPACIVL
ncbi:hypothetical protein DES53_102773 [Roseimicrobium gellanilyticum]|uniref:Uncharacterized protein n=1 Tax=Roseimicrobium gellanilyticum TaxID=748857 RepID=A0A366HRT1_9BACT|nr:hypothetical protein [Roseimicrobium gellanilyticum]RBP46382.1 hypothetical protein DES53_102773 [Roseimicrobium gellanilyticum]